MFTNKNYQLTKVNTMTSYTDVFTTNENTTDGAILDRIYELIENQHLTTEDKVNIIRLTLEYAKETN